ncbi:MAG: hypothetical protein QOD98_2839 [Nocardioidaceae bacterium]|nr:hypothetical protein [Nocardioidaceae bacterium]
MPVSYAGSSSISAPPDRVWARLTDAASYPQWNPTVVKLDGAIAPGQKIKLVSTLDPKRTFSLKVAELDPPRRMVWSSGMPLGLFTGRRTFTLTPRADGGTDFTMEEAFSGPMAPLITRAIPDMTESFAQFAAALKATAEAG